MGGCSSNTVTKHTKEKDTDGVQIIDVGDVETGTVNDAKKRKDKNEKKKEENANRKWNGPEHTDGVVMADDDDIEDITMSAEPFVQKPMPPKRDPFARDFAKESKDAELFVNLARQQRAKLEKQDKYKTEAT